MNTHTMTLVAIGLASVGFLLVAGVAIFTAQGRRGAAASWRYFVRRSRGLLRHHLIYRRHWKAFAVNRSLTAKKVVKKKNATTGKKELKPETSYPEIRRMVSSKTVDHFRVKMLPGQTLEDWTAATTSLAVLYGGAEARIRTARTLGVFGKGGKTSRRVLDITVLRRDPLRAPVTSWPLLEADKIDFKRLSVAVDENGDPFHLQVLGTHILIVGATGSGKGSALWSPIEQLAPAIGAGLVKMLGIDPKFLELSMGARLFEDTATGSDPVKMAELLEKGVSIMQDRQARMAGKSRLHKVSTDEPLWVIVIDEVLALTSVVKDRKLRDRIDAAFTLLLSQGRALGVSMIMASQDPRKEGMAWRGLVPTKVLLRVNEAADVDMVMGAGARARGALADQIDNNDETPGTSYVWGEGIREPLRIRYPHVSDARLRELQDLYGKPADGGLVVVPEAA